MEHFIGHTIQALHLKNPPDLLRGFALKLSVRNTLTRVPPSDLCQFTHIKRILSLGCMDDWMCAYSYPQNDSTREDLICLASVCTCECRQKGCVPTLSTWVRLKIQQRTSLLSGLTALTQSLLSAPFHSDTLIQLHITWLLLYLILIKRAGVYLSRPCHPCKGIN